LDYGLTPLSSVRYFFRWRRAMKAILVREFGGPEVLKLEEVPTPKPAAGQVLVRIHAVGVNPYDTNMRAGT
jgi:NADPH2:quinone reductase